MEILVASDCCIHSLTDFWTNITSTVILSLHFTLAWLYQVAACLLLSCPDHTKIIISGTNKMLNVPLWTSLSGQGCKCLCDLSHAFQPSGMGQAIAWYVQGLTVEATGQCAEWGCQAGRQEVFVLGLRTNFSEPPSFIKSSPHWHHNSREELALALCCPEWRMSVCILSILSHIFFERKSTLIVSLLICI